MKTTTAKIGALLAVALLAGCGRAAAPQVPAQSPSIRGVITSIESADGTSASARIVWTADPAVGAKAEYDAAQVTIGPETAVRRRTAGTDEAASVADLRVGQVVEAWFGGAVAESYPVQVGATAIVIVGTYGGELPVPPGLEPEPVPTP